MKINYCSSPGRVRVFAALSAMLLWSSPGCALAPLVDPAELLPTPEQRRATRLITQRMEQEHYKKTRLTDRLSIAISDKYLENLDPARSYFLTQDIEAFGKYRTSFDDQLRDADLGPAFEIFKTFLKRSDERIAYAKDLLKSRFDFTVDEEFVPDREKAPWPANPTEMDDLWRKRVKNDYLSLKIAGKKETEIADILRKRYDDMARRFHQINSDDVFQTFINSYTLAVEPHTSYLSPRTSENFEINMSLSLEGIGAELTVDNEYTLVQRIVPKGPADKSKELHSGDRISGVAQGDNGVMVDVIGWRLDDVVDLIRGPKDSVVRLNVLSKSVGVDGPSKTVRLVRKQISLEEHAAQKSVLEVKGPSGKTKIGVIKLPAFYMAMSAKDRGEENYRSTTRDVNRLVGELTQEKVSGILLDLRDNGGGSLTEATDLTGLFIDRGPVVQVRHSSGMVEVQRDREAGTAYDGPMAVLIDRNSASASEIFAGAMQDYRRALVIGEPSYGKGTVQNLIFLDRHDDTGKGGLGTFKMTVAQFFRVSGSSTQNRGVVPDIIFPTASNSDKEGERSIPNALPWASIHAASFEPATIKLGDIEALRRSHQARIAADPGFNALREEVDMQREASNQKSLSLVESKRRKERDGKLQRWRALENQLRISRGLSPLAADADLEDQKEQPKDKPDILLSEAANVLSDMIAQHTAPATRQAATDGKAQTH